MDEYSQSKKTVEESPKTSFLYVFSAPRVGLPKRNLGRYRKSAIVAPEFYYKATLDLLGDT